MKFDKPTVMTAVVIAVIVLVFAAKLRQLPLVNKLPTF